MKTRKSETGRIGIMGGTFDPVHIGHLFAAEEAKSVLGLERMIFVPSGIPPHKSYSGMASAKERYEMALLAASYSPYNEVSDIELERDGKNYTVDTLRAFTGVYPDSELYFIMGADAAADFLTWREPEEVSVLAKLVVVSRPGYRMDVFDSFPEWARRSFIRIDTAELEVSATDIRARAAAGRNFAFLVPAPVQCYIMRNGLYTDMDGELA